MTCGDCKNGAAADSKGEFYYCIGVNKLRRAGESRRQFLERNRVRGKAECAQFEARDVR